MTQDGLTTTEATGRSLQPAPAGERGTWGARHAHDPTVVKADDGTYYMFSTDAVAAAGDVPAGVHVRTSPDLLTWTFVGTAMDGIPGPAAEWSGAAGLWAPEVVRWPNDDWHMYYSASTFGSNTSAIGLAVAPSPAGPWVDRGIVVATREGESTQNAIDAAVTFDRNGAPWLTYGSFFSGIYTLPLDPATGGAADDGGMGTLIARRHPSVEGAIEGAFILYRREEDRYVLFASYDSLFDTYNVRVAVAADITGPYRDVNGGEMTDVEASPASVGTKVLGSYHFDGDTVWQAPGHNSILVEAGENSDEYFMVHHVRFASDPTQHIGQIRRLFFTSGGWPVVSPQPFRGRENEATDDAALQGSWQVIRFDPFSSAVAEAHQFPVESADGSALSAVPAALRLRVADVELDGVVFGSWDWSRARPALSFSGIDADGIVWSGTKGGRA